MVLIVNFCNQLRQARQGRGLELVTNAVAVASTKIRAAVKLNFCSSLSRPDIYSNPVKLIVLHILSNHIAIQEGTVDRGVTNVIWLLGSNLSINEYGPTI